MAEMIIFFASTVLLCVGTFLLYADRRRKRPLRPTKLMAIELKERTHEVIGDPSWESEFRPMVEMARGHFPTYHVWGQYILGGTGYGIFVTDGKKKSMFQAKSTMKVSGVEIDNDIRRNPDIKKALIQAFEAMKKSLQDKGETVGSKPR